MWWLMFAAFAGAVLMIPGPSLSAARLRQVGLLPARRRRSLAGLLALQRRPRVVVALAGLVAAGLGAVSSLAVTGEPVAMALPAAAAALLGVVVCQVVLTETASRRADREALAVCDALACLADELRAGQRPGLALAAAGQACGHATVAGVFGRAAATAAFGGEVASAFSEQTAVLDHGSAARAGVEALTAAWRVSERAGASLATVVERLADDLRSRRRQRERVLAELAGPRATAVLLALLPGVGVLLAAGTGVRPAQILFGTTAGQVALLAGAGLDAVGVVWCMRILTAAGPES